VGSKKFRVGSAHPRPPVAPPLQAAKCVSASQMVQLLKFISFDDTKLEVAKMGYQYTTDPHSYGNTVGGILSFSDAKDELNAHIRQNPHPPPEPAPQPTVIIYKCPYDY
jgi:hypothetical protein